MQLSHMKTGDKGRIIRIKNSDKVYRKRLIAMGLIPGTDFCVVRIAPLGDPIEIEVRGFALSLRQKEAAVLEIEGIK